MRNSIIKSIPSLCTCITFGLFAVMSLTSCEKEVPLLPVSIDQDAVQSATGTESSELGKRGRVRYEETEVAVPIGTYQLTESIDADPLYRFSISNSGDQITLESNPDVAMWGTDFWGTWSDPYAFANNAVNYITGLTNLTYQLERIPGNRIRVTRTLIVQPYPSGTPTTTVTTPGIYERVD